MGLGGPVVSPKRSEKKKAAPRRKAPPAPAQHNLPLRRSGRRCGGGGGGGAGDAAAEVQGLAPRVQIALVLLLWETRILCAGFHIGQCSYAALLLLGLV